MSTNESIQRLHWGCGGEAPADWLNADARELPGVQIVCDIRQGLPIAEGSITYGASIHALQEVPATELVVVLSELRRVLKPGGVFRFCLPDLEKGIAAYQRGDRDYFFVPDEDARSLGGKFITHILWYGYSRVMFTPDYIEELLIRAGFSAVNHCKFQQTASAWPEITRFDNREQESLFVEGVK